MEVKTDDVWVSHLDIDFYHYIHRILGVLGENQTMSLYGGIKFTVVPPPTEYGSSAKPSLTKETVETIETIEDKGKSVLHFQLNPPVNAAQIHPPLLLHPLRRQKAPLLASGLLLSNSLPESLKSNPLPHLLDHLVSPTRQVLLAL